MNEIAQFDPKTVEAAVAEEIKTRFASMVPAGAWEGLVKKHVTDFLTGDGKGTLKEIVYSRLEEAVKKELDIYFGPNGKWGFQWEDGKRIASDEVEKLIMKNMPVIIATMMGSAVSATVEMMRQRLNNGSQW
jgi:hypothetical protein